MATWRALIEEVTDEIKEELIYCTLTDFELDKYFNLGFGPINGEPFTAWTENYVLFPLQYDGAELVGYAPRNPCDIKMKHQG